MLFRSRGRPAHVLLSIDEYRRLAGLQISLASAVAQPDGRLAAIRLELAPNLVSLLPTATSPAKPSTP